MRTAWNKTEPTDKDELIRLFVDEQWSVKRVGKAFGHSGAWAFKWLKEYGIDTKQKGRKKNPASIAKMKETKRLHPPKPNSGCFKKGLVPHNNGKHQFLERITPECLKALYSDYHMNSGQIAKLVKTSTATVCKYLRVIGIGFRQKRSFWKGKKRSKETCERISKGRKGWVPPPDFHLRKKGRKPWNWQGGINRTNKSKRKWQAYKDWRLRVYEQDKYTCRDCGVKGQRLHAHHILPFADPMYDEFKYDDRNGVTLCVACHKQRHKTMRDENRVK